MPLTVSKDILCQIGAVAVHQSHIEGQMALFIQELLYLDEQRGNIITSRMSFRALIDTLELLLIEEFGSDHRYFKTFEALQDEMNKREQRRNEIVHSYWAFGSTFGPDSATRTKITKRKARREIYPETVDELKDIAKAMDSLEINLGRLRVQICHSEASARKSRA